MRKADDAGKDKSFCYHFHEKQLETDNANTIDWFNKWKDNIALQIPIWRNTVKAFQSDLLLSAFYKISLKCHYEELMAQSETCLNNLSNVISMETSN